MYTILRPLLIMLIFIVGKPVFTESQGDLRSKKNIHISIIKLKGYGIQSEYFLNSNFSLGIGVETSKFYQNKAIWGTYINSIFYENDIKDYRRNNLYLNTNYYPFNSLGLYLIGMIGYATGSSLEVNNRLLFGLNGDLLPAYPKEQYGHKIEESPRGYIGAGFGYKHIFSSGVFLGSEFDLNLYPRQRVGEKYTIYPDSTTLLPGAKLDAIDYLYLRQAALDSYHPQKGFGQLKLFFGIAF